MRRLFAALILLAGIPAFAQTIRDVDILVEVDRDGSAWITQEWDVDVVSGTEWFIPVGNLGPMRLSGLTVSENGRQFQFTDPWDSDAGLAGKAGKCGIIPKSDGVELVWGQGSMGDHRWTVRFHVTGLVQALQDADAFNFMFVNPGMVSPPQHARVVIRPAFEGTAWTQENTSVWGFGHTGEIGVVSGMVVDETSEPLKEKKGSVIVLVRFDKGLFEPAISRDVTFQQVWDEAKKNSDYKEDYGMLYFFAVLFGGGLFYLLFALIAKALGYRYRKTLFGKRKITGWWREVPLEGNLLAASFVLTRGERFGAAKPPTTQMIGAMFLRWVMDGKLSVVPDPRSSNRVQLRFLADHVSGDDAEESMFQMAREASGTNLLLEKGEFENWSRKHYTRMTGWPARAIMEGQRWFREKGLFAHGKTTNAAGAAEACHLVEFKNFLKDFTLSKERGAIEVGMWKEYLVYAQLFGIADRVASQFKKLYPAEFEELARQTGLDAHTLTNTVYWTNTLSGRAFGSATIQSARIAGKGGATSFGGGGGFSGGGFGGGSR